MAAMAAMQAMQAGRERRFAAPKGWDEGLGCMKTDLLGRLGDEMGDGRVNGRALGQFYDVSAGTDRPWAGIFDGNGVEADLGGALR